MDLYPKFMNEIFVEKRNSYILRGNNNLYVPIPHSDAYGIDKIRYTGFKLWNSLPMGIKVSNTLIEFKRKVKRYQFKNCNCRLCKKFITNLGLI